MQSIYAGTWGSDTGPVEVQWAEMLREYPGHTWQDLMDMPPYPRRVLWDALQARRAAEQAASERGGAA